MSTLLKLDNLQIEFKTAGAPLKALNGISLEIQRGEIFGIVGETGCGKTITGLSVLRLLPKTASLRGQILLSEQVYLLARDFIETGHINEVFVKGKKSVVRMFELLAIHRAPAVRVPPGDIRKGPRVEVDMPVQFQLLDGKSVLPEKIVGRIVDMSYGGLYIHSPVLLPLYCDVKMVLSVSLLVQDRADVYGKVLRVTPVADGFEYRIEFTSIDVPAQRALKEFVDRLVEIK